MKFERKWVVIIALIYVFLLVVEITTLSLEVRSHFQPGWDKNIRGIPLIVIYKLFPKIWWPLSIWLFPVLSSVLIASIGAIFYSLKRDLSFGKGTTLLWGSFAFILAAIPPLAVPESWGDIHTPFMLLFLLGYLYLLPFILMVILSIYSARKVTVTKYIEKLKTERKHYLVRRFFVFLVGFQVVYAAIGTTIPAWTWKWVGDVDWAQEEKRMAEEERQSMIAMEIEIPHFTFAKPAGLYPPGETRYKESTSRLVMSPRPNSDREYSIEIEWATKGKGYYKGHSIGSESYFIWNKEFKINSLEEGAQAYHQIIKEDWEKNHFGYGGEERYSFADTRVAGIPAILVEMQSKQGKERYSDQLGYTRCTIFRKDNILYAISVIDEIYLGWDVQEQITRLQQEMDEILNSFKLKN